MNILKKEQKKDIDLITKIVLEHCKKNIEKLPKDISDSTVIHLRLGDVIGGTTKHERSKTPLPFQYYNDLLKDNNDKKYIIGKCFFAKTSTKNFDTCINLSNEYLKSIISELHAEHFDSGNPDIDLCCAVKSKLFIQGKGFYSKLIVDIRNKLGLDNIETTVFNKL